jgi:hypothetical protein
MSNPPIGQQLNLINQPPVFCEYSGGPCDQLFEGTLRSEALLFDPNEPQIIAATIAEAVRQLRIAADSRRSVTWKDLNVSGPYSFIGARTNLSPSEVGIALLKAGMPAEQTEKVRELLSWFGFLGIFVYPVEERYSYQYEHNLQKMKSGIDQFSYCIHPAFRQSLGCHFA